MNLVFIAGGYQLRTKRRFADAIRAANAGSLRDAGVPELTPSSLESRRFCDAPLQQFVA